MAEAPNESNQNSNHGLFIRGTYLGRQAPRTFTRAGTDEVVNVKPKIGISCDGTEYSVKGADDPQIDAALAGKIKGDLVTIRIEAVAPFGTNKPVDFTLPGVVAARSESWR